MPQHTVNAVLDALGASTGVWVARYEANGDKPGLDMVSIRIFESALTLPPIQALAVSGAIQKAVAAIQADRSDEMDEVTGRYGFFPYCHVSYELPGAIDGFTLRGQVVDMGITEGQAWVVVNWGKAGIGMLAVPDVYLHRAAVDD